MEQTEFDAMEVKPANAGWYLVTLFQFEKEDPEHPDYIRDWVEYDGENWLYGGYSGCCYVCFVHRRDDT